jgi:hypothetical protein
MPISLERISELLELPVQNLDEQDKDSLHHLANKTVDKKGEQHLSQNKSLLKDQFEYLRTLQNHPNPLMLYKTSFKRGHSPLFSFLFLL